MLQEKNGLTDEKQQNDDIYEYKDTEDILFLLLCPESHQDIVPTLWSVNFTKAPGQTQTQ